MPKQRVKLAQWGRKIFYRKPLSGNCTADPNFEKCLLEGYWASEHFIFQSDWWMNCLSCSYIYCNFQNTNFIWFSLISNSSKFFCTYFFPSFFNVASFPSILRKFSHPWGRFSFNWWQWVNWVVKQLMFTSNVQKPLSVLHIELLLIKHFLKIYLFGTNGGIISWKKRKGKIRPINLAIPLAGKQNHSGSKIICTTPFCWTLKIMVHLWIPWPG
jgi:hypothetical protein